jgi:hypothetical protein
VVLFRLSSSGSRNRFGDSPVRVVAGLEEACYKLGGGVIALVAGLLIIAYRIPYGGRNKGNSVRRVKFLPTLPAATDEIVLGSVSI